MEFIEGLRSLGVSRNVAKLITYLKGMDESSSRDIEMSTGLRQPEVSIATRPLREMGWISERDVKRSGKGRPHKIYALRATDERRRSSKASRLGVSDSLAILFSAS